MTVTKKAIKQLHLRVYPDGRVTLSVPKRMTNAEIDRFLSEKAEWIKKQLALLPARPRGELTETWVQGKMKHLSFVNADHACVRETTDELIVFAPEGAHKKVLAAWRVKLCKQLLSASMHKMYPFAEARGVPLPHVTVRAMTSRWGSCSYKKGRITLNSFLTMADEECMDYVVLHELAHFLYPNHQKGFHDFLLQCMPAYRLCEERLQTRFSPLMAMEKGE